MARKKEPAPYVSEEDRALFLEALGRGKFNLEETKEAAVRSNEEDFETLLNTVPVIDKDAIELSSGRQRKRPDLEKRPKYALDATIDLHGMVLEAALKALDRFLLRTQSKHFTRVLVIHGKGSGVLKNGVRAHLQGHESVSQWRVAPPRLGHEGAVIVDLRRKK